MVLAYFWIYRWELQMLLKIPCRVRRYVFFYCQCIWYQINSPFIYSLGIKNNSKIIIGGHCRKSCDMLFHFFSTSNFSSACLIFPVKKERVWMKILNIQEAKDMYLRHYSSFVPLNTLYVGLLNRNTSL